MMRVIISGGGTGGHIFPAIAIANALKSKVSDMDILFIGAKGRMEMEKVPAAGYRIEGLTVSGFQRRLTLKNLSFPFKLLASLLKARAIISKFKPDLVIGVGGYASGPTLRMATSKKIPSLIQEQNSFPGITNRLLGSRVQKICVAYEGMDAYFPKEKIVMTGNPIRRDVIDMAGKEDEAMAYFGLVPGKKTLLVIGGSLGAGTINQAILKFVQTLQAKLNTPDIQILWQTGKYYFDTIATHFPEQASRKPGSASPGQVQSSTISNLQSGKPNVVILPFIDRMDLAYAAADIIVSRAGAIAISELCVVGKPVILVPSPNVAEDHQTKNARALVNKNSAVMVPDKMAMESLGKTVVDLFDNQALRFKLGANITTLGVSNAADTIAEVALSMIGKKYKAGISANEVKDFKPEIVNRTSGIKDIKSVYFLGIGGIGMSALARYFVLQGASVSGYDKTPTSLTDQLISEGMQIHFVEDIHQIPASPDLVIYTPAVPREHREMIFFKEQGIPMKKRAEVLGMISDRFQTIAVAGTHGKTTTSTMIAHMLKTAGVDHLAFLGGISKNYGTNFLFDLKDNLSGNSYCVVEADEYDRSFLQLSPSIAIITSADADHLDIYGNHDDLKKTFSEFTAKITANGSLILKAGTQVIPVLTNTYAVYDYSLSGSATFYAQNIRLTEGELHYDFVYPGGTIQDLILGVPGRFNLENSVAALAVGSLLGIDHDLLKKAFRTYTGVQRRFDIRVRRPDMVYIDDYAHHPEELKACITSVAELFPGKRITGVFQPHLYSRTRDLADAFAQSLDLLDELLLLEIYPAREEPMAGVTSQIILDRMQSHHKKLVKRNNLLEEIRNARPEILLTMGAGDIDHFVLPITEMLSEGKSS